VSTLNVAGRPVKVTNPDRVMYAAGGMSKRQVIAYFVAAASALLPALAERPLTRRRWPEGTGGEGFFEKSAPRGMPDWIRTVELQHNRASVRYPVIENPAALAWLGQVGALELHVPQWRLHSKRRARRLVIDLDPGPPAGLAQAAEVALALRALLLSAGIESIPVTSGSKGIHVYADVRALPSAATTRDLALQLGQRLEASMGSLVVTDMARHLRPHKVLVDWSQNSPAKTTICPYSLRGTPSAKVAAPRTWDEIAAPVLAHLTPQEVLGRLESGIEPFGALADT
jgi:bifunctional non-homologous end joining protein LigD